MSLEDLHDQELRLARARSIDSRELVEFWQCEFGTCRVLVEAPASRRPHTRDSEHVRVGRLYRSGKLVDRP